ncbi:MAG TPA: O-antigen ligase family protein [Candidatus Binatia bacterium]|nr:O-antigen ligase family protein [Candidatus Binatia bacterium]
MARTSAIEWWRPEGAQEAAPSGVGNARGGALPFRMLMAFTIFMLLAPQDFFPALEGLRLPLVVALLATAAYVWDRIVHNMPFAFAAREFWLIALLTAWAVLTTPLSYDPKDSWSFLLTSYSRTIAVFWLVSNVINTGERLRRAFWTLTLIALPLALTAIEHYVTGAFTETGGRITGYDAPLTANPNDLALMLNLVLPLSIALLMLARKVSARLLLLAGIALSAAGVIITFSRGGFITLATLLLLYVWKLRARPQRRWVWGVIGVILVCIPVVGPSYLDRLATITNFEADKSGSAQERWADMTAAAAFTIEHPFIGAGIGQNTLAVQEERGPDGGIVHNVYLEYSVELGFIGLAIFLLFYLASIKSAVSIQRGAAKEGDMEMSTLGEAIQLSLIAFGVAAMFHPVAYHPYLYYFAGLAVAGKNAFESRQDSAWKRAK